MVEEIADSMTFAGIIAAVVGLCTALTIMVLHFRERRRSEPEDILQASNEEDVTAPSVSTEVVAAPSAPKSAFKTFVPSTPANVSRVEMSSSSDPADAVK